MAFTGDFMCTTFKQELLLAEHNFAVAGADFKIPLYDNTATLTAATAAYTTSGELAASGNYTTKGQSLTNIAPTTSGTTALLDFEDEVYANATFTARGAMIFNEDHAKPDASVIILDFTSDKTATAGDFTIQFPVADASNAIIRIA